MINRSLNQFTVEDSLTKVVFFLKKQNIFVSFFGIEINNPPYSVYWRCYGAFLFLFCKVMIFSSLGNWLL